MDKLVFRKFAKLVGNEEDLVPFANEYDEEYPDGWDEMSEEKQAEWKKAHMMKANADQPEVIPAPVQNQRPAPVIPQRAEIPAEIMQLNALVKEIGGTEALRTLLLSAATITANIMAKEETEKGELISVIKANSAEFDDEKELEALYQFDLAFFDLADQTSRALDTLEASLADDAALPAAIRNLTGLGRMAVETYNRRREAITGKS